MEAVAALAGSPSRPPPPGEITAGWRRWLPGGSTLHCGRGAFLLWVECRAAALRRVPGATFGRLDAPVRRPRHSESGTTTGSPRPDTSCQKSGERLPP